MVGDGIALDSDQKLRIVLAGIGDARLISGLSATTSDTDRCEWTHCGIHAFTSPPDMATDRCRNCAQSA